MKVSYSILARNGTALSNQIREILDLCIECLRSRKGEELFLIDLRTVSDVADYFLICTGTSSVHVKALADALREGTKAAGYRQWHIEGLESRIWVLFDYIDVVVHIFQPKARAFYRLERLWGDAPSERIEEDPSVAETSSIEGRSDHL
jgi:ribosome-associated protein